MIDTPDLRHLRYFVVLAEELSFGRAAERLGITQPTLSLQIQALERQVGAPLLSRRPRVRLTEVGTALLGDARQALTVAAAALDAARRTARGERGVLTLGVVSSTLLVPALAGAIRRYRERYPVVELRLRELPTFTQLEALRDRRIDVGLLRQPPTDTEVIRRAVARERLVVALPSAHRLASQERLQLSALAGEPFVFFPRAVNPHLYDHMIEVCRRAGVAPRVVQEATEFQTCVSLVETGLGVTIVPDGIRRIRAPGVVYRKLRDARAYTDIALCWRRGDDSARVAALAGLMPGI
jgi:DNA-binding transcriptional LysR family regulator